MDYVLLVYELGDLDMKTYKISFYLYYYSQFVYELNLILHKFLCFYIQFVYELGELDMKALKNYHFKSS